MIKFLKYILSCTLFFTAVTTFAQSTSTSPYSQFGLGDLKGSLLPQTRAMGGISMGLRKPGPYNNINLANPASYSAIQLTTFDIGASTDLRQLSKSGVSENTFNGSLSHITFGVPVSKNSAISFGILPFSNLGYQYKNASQIVLSPTESVPVSYVYGGDGGLSKAYLGYGFQVVKNLSAGFNAAYVFGNLKNTRSAEFPADPAALNSRTQESKSVSGLSFDYGLQYAANLSKNTKLIIGYTGNAGTSLNSTKTVVTTRYKKNFSTGDESGSLDTTFFSENAKIKLSMPMTHTFGFAFEKTNNWLVGADISYSNWAGYREDNVNPGLNNSYGIGVGGQFTPDATAVSNYFKVVDYRLGFKYDKTYIRLNNTDIKQYAITAGLGLPLQSSRLSAYKINVSAELGQRGTMSNSLVRERYVNINIGFILNDKWFQKAKFD